MYKGSALLFLGKRVGKELLSETKMYVPSSSRENPAMWDEKTDISTLHCYGVENIWPVFYIWTFLLTWPTHSISAWIYKWEICESPLVVSMIPFFPQKHQRQGYHLVRWSLCKMLLRPFPAQGCRIFQEYSHTSEEQPHLARCQAAHWKCLETSPWQSVPGYMHHYWGSACPELSDSLFLLSFWYSFSSLKKKSFVWAALCWSK